MDALAQLPQLIITGITSGCIYAIVAVGFSIIYNSTQVINLAQGEFVMVGAMVAATMPAALCVGWPAAIAAVCLLVALTTVCRSVPLAARIPLVAGAAFCLYWAVRFCWHYTLVLGKLHLPVTVLVAILAGCLVGAFLALCLLIPLKRSTVLTMIIVTIGASIMFRGLAQMLWGETAKSVDAFTGKHTVYGVEDHVISLWGTNTEHYTCVTAQQLWVVGITVLLVVGMSLFFRYTLIGKAMKACAMNAAGAKLVGISVRKMIVLSFVLAAALGAVAGVTIAPISKAGVGMGIDMGLRGFCAAVLGGLGSFGGGVVAGILLGIVESIGGFFYSDYKDAIAFVILIAILLIRPEGLLSRRKAEARL